MATNLRPPISYYIALFEERGRTARPIPVTSVLGRKNYIAAPKSNLLTMEESLIENPNSAQSP